MNKLVTFELAKSLKEKGFDEYCSFIWSEENLEEPDYYAESYTMIGLQIHYYGNIPMVNNSYIEKYATYVEKDEITEEVYELLAAPTISEVVMWLYEKHGFWVSVSKDYDKPKFGYGVLKPNSYSLLCSDIENDTYNSPSEAYEAAIEYTLNNLL